MTSAAGTSGFLVRGWHVLVALVVFFGIDIAVNTYFIVSAYRTFPGETSLTPYEDGVAYNAALAQKRAQAVLGWRLAAGEDQAGRIRVDVADRTGAPLTGLNVSAHLERPATQAGERDVTLAEAESGVYLGAVGPLAGAWDLQITARDAVGHLAKAERRLAPP